MIKKFLTVSVMLFSSVAYSQQATQEGFITRLVVHNGDEGLNESQRVRVALSGEISTPLCSSGEWALSLSNEASKAQYALLLASYMSGKAVSLAGNSTENCIVGYEVIRNVSIVPN